FSQRYARGEPAQLGVVVDNTDNTAANVIVQELRGAFLGVNTELRAVSSAPVFPGVQVERVDVYGHKEFMQYLVPGVIALALFFIAMLAGGIILVDDRARGIHEGYFVTPLSSLDVVTGLTLSGVTLAVFVGTSVLIASVVIARVPIIGGLGTI